MEKSFSEQKELAKKFSFQVDRMCHCLRSAGYEAQRDDVVRAWIDYSESLCAGWLMMPDDDDSLLSILVRHLAVTQNEKEKAIRYTTQIIDAGDGSGDGIVELPYEILAVLDWHEGDLLNVEMREQCTLLIERTDDKK